MDVGPRSANDVGLCQNKFWQCNFLCTKDMLKRLHFFMLQLHNVLCSCSA